MKKIIVIFILVGIAAFSSCKKEPEVSYAAQLAMDIAAIDQYLQTNSINAIQDTSGMRYVVVKQGTGKIPLATDQVALNITYRNLDNSILSSDTTGIAYILSQQVYGLELGLLKMPRGSTYTFYIPSGLAFGTDGYNGIIAPNTNLIVNVTLRDDLGELAKEDAIIDSYLKSKGDTVLKDTSGVRVVITKHVPGESPILSSTVTINYSGAIFNSSSAFATGNLFGFSVNDPNIISGLRIGITYVHSSENAIIYIPSRLAYGYPGSSDGTIPKSAILVFTVTLVNFD